MNGAADLGGMMGFGPVVEEANEPLFHELWEARILGMVIALGACGQWNIDMSRHARESLQPADYLKSSYYTIWMEAATRLMIDRGMVTAAELRSCKANDPPIPVARTLKAADVEAVLRSGSPVRRPAKKASKFDVGDPVRTINDHPETHTRLPRYARDKAGIVTKVHGCHVFPDSNALGQGENPQWLYKVTFSGKTLWGRQGGENDRVSIDLWEPYLLSGK